MAEHVNLKPRLSYRYFTASEVETVTGVAQSTIRNWRRFKYIASNLAYQHNRFFPTQMMIIWVMGLLAARGVGPAISSKIAPGIAQRLVQYAEALREAAPADMPDYYRLHEKHSDDRYVVWFPSGIVGFGQHVDQVLAGKGQYTVRADGDQAELSDLAATGALIVFDLPALAVEIIARTGPLWIPNPAYIQQNPRPAEGPGLDTPSEQSSDQSGLVPSSETRPAAGDIADSSSSDDL